MADLQGTSHQHLTHAERAAEYAVPVSKRPVAATMTLTEARAITRSGPWLYRLYDHDGVLLYIGKTVRLPSERFDGHKSQKPLKTWWCQVARVSLEHHLTDWDCLDAERAAIKAEAPHHNRRSVPLAQR